MNRDEVEETEVWVPGTNF